MLSDEQLTTIVAEASVGLHFGPTQAEFTERVRGACEAALEADRAERGKGRPSDEEIQAKWKEIWLGPKYLGRGCVECAIEFANWVADRCQCQSVSEEEVSRKHVSRVLARAVLEIADALDIKVDQDVHRIALGRRLEDRCQSASEEEAEPHLDRGPAREEEQAVGHARHVQALIAKWNRRAEANWKAWS